MPPSTPCPPPLSQHQPQRSTVTISRNAGRVHASSKKCLDDAKVLFLAAKKSFEDSSSPPDCKISSCRPLKTTAARLPAYTIKDVLTPKTHLTNATRKVFIEWLQVNHPGWSIKRRRTVREEDLKLCPSRSNKQAYFIDVVYQNPSSSTASPTASSSSSSNSGTILKTNKKRKRKQKTPTDEKSVTSKTNNHDEDGTKKKAKKKKDYNEGGDHSPLKGPPIGGLIHCSGAASCSHDLDTNEEERPNKRQRRKQKTAAYNNSGESLCSVGLSNTPSRHKSRSPGPIVVPFFSYKGKHADDDDTVKRITSWCMKTSCHWNNSPLTIPQQNKARITPTRGRPFVFENGESCFLALPDSIQTEVFGYADVSTLGALACTSRTMHYTVLQDCFWERHLKFLLETLFDDAIQDDLMPISRRPNWRKSTEFRHWYSGNCTFSEDPNEESCVITTIPIRKHTVGGSTLDVVDDYELFMGNFTDKKAEPFEWLLRDVPFHEYYKQAGAFAVESLKEHYGRCRLQRRCPKCTYNWWDCRCLPSGDMGCAGPGDELARMPRIRLFSNVQ